MKNKGFTLIELVLSAIILTIIIGIITYAFRMVQNNLSGSIAEYDYQSQAREAMSDIKSKIETTKAVYVMKHSDFYSGTSGAVNPKSHWDYYSLSADKKQVLHYRYDASTDKHDTVVLLQAKDGQKIDLKFSKKEIPGLTPEEQLHSKYLVFRYVILDDKGNELRSIETEVEARNAFKVTDEREDTSLPTDVLSFRSNTKAGDEPIVFITMVVDTSTSMTYDINGNPISSGESRFNLLKKALNGYDSTTHHSGLLEKFATSDNLFITLVPYATTANYPEQLKYEYYEQGIIRYDWQWNGYKWVRVPVYGDIGSVKLSDQNHPIYLMSNSSEFDKITEQVNNINIFIGAESAGTNTGDGIRRAYFAHQNLKQSLSDRSIDITGRPVIEYMIVLLDGNVTYSTWNGYGASGGNYKITDGAVTDVNVIRYSSHESNYVNACILGRGNETSELTDTYVKLVGSLVKRKKIKSFVIGFTNQPDERQSLGMIASSLGSNKVYEYSDDFNLEAIFDDIYNKINIDLWILQGPHD